MCLRSDTPMSDLRRQMIQDMRIAGFAISSQQRYVEAILRFAESMDLKPDEAEERDLAAHFLDIQQTMAAGTFRAHRAALLFLFRNTLQRPWPLLKKKWDRPRGVDFHTLWSIPSACAC